MKQINKKVWIEKTNIVSPTGMRTIIIHNAIILK